MAKFPLFPCLFLCAVFSFFTLIPTVKADGVGILGAGKWLYKPVCAKACRRLIATCPILCEEEIQYPNNTSSNSSSAHNHSKIKRQHSHQPSKAECFLKDAAFLRTQALCMNERCPRDNIALSVMEEYWEGHMATGTVGNWNLRPIMSYSKALMLAQEDVKRIGGQQNLPIAVSGQPLNQTSWISEAKWLPSYNGQFSFQEAEHAHGRNSLAIAITTCTIPILFSLLRFLPGANSRAVSRISAILDQPLYGSRHRKPIQANLGIMPTRGQTVFIAYIILTNIFLLIYPHHILQPNYSAPTEERQLYLIFGDRAGVLAFANFVALFLFSSRNNLLLWITNWSHSTFLLLHRWVGYVCIMQSVLHSAILLAMFMRWKDHATESKLPYWYWGIVATLAIVLILPLSILPIRQRMYQAFLATHQMLAALTLIASFLHMWYIYEYNWGYEIWIYVAGGLWFFDRTMRLLRIARNGIRTANITAVGTEGEYLRINVDGIATEGHIYLLFPTLSWKFWESHPFSVLSSFTGGSTTPNSTPRLVSSEKTRSKIREDEKTSSTVNKEVAILSSSQSSNGSENHEPDDFSPIRPCTSLLVRTQQGVTRLLSSRLKATGTNTLKIPVLIESSYHSGPSLSSLSHCSTLIAVCGGVGITAILPLLNTFPGPKINLFWGVRNQSLVDGIQRDLDKLRFRGRGRVSIEIFVSKEGRRMNVGEVVKEELMRGEQRGDRGHVGIVVCGPTGMADEVREAVGKVVGGGMARKRGVVFIDEGFSW